MGEQDRALSPAADGSAEENGISSAEQSKRDSKRSRAIICGSCCALTTLIVGLVILILAFTVFKIKSPMLTFNTVKIQGLDAVVRQGPKPKPGLNMTFVSDLSIKNPNSASFKFTNATTWLYYGNKTIGEVRSPPGNAKAHKTIHLNVTMDVIIDTIASVSRFASDVIAGEMPIATYTDMHGRVNVMNIIKKHIDIELNCTMTIVIETQSVKDKVCEKTVHM